MTERLEDGAFLAALRARLGLTLLVVSLATTAGYVATTLMPKVYAATASVLVGQTTEAANLTRDDILASQDLASTYSDLARREPVLARAVTQLGLDSTWEELRTRVLVSRAPANNQLIVVTAHGDSPREATQVARSVTEQLITLAPQREDDPNVAFVETQVQLLEDEIKRRQAILVDVVLRQARASSVQQAQGLQDRADTLLRQISDLQGNYTNLRDLLPSGRGPNTLTVLEPAAAGQEPIRPNLPVNVLISAIVGLLVAAGLSYFLEFHHPRSASPYESWDGRGQADMSRDADGPEPGSSEPGTRTTHGANIERSATSNRNQDR